MEKVRAVSVFHWGPVTDGCVGYLSTVLNASESHGDKVGFGSSSLFVI